MLTLIAMPVYGGTGNEYEGLDGLVAVHLAAARAATESAFMRMNNGVVDRARCELAAIFLASNAERLLFWDSDIALRTEAVLAMEEASDAGAPIVTVPYLRRGGQDFVTTGMGATMLRRDFLEQVRADHPELLYQSSFQELGFVCGLFLPMIQNGQYLAEDAAFLARGGKSVTLLTGHPIYHAGVWGTYER